MGSCVPLSVSLFYTSFIVQRCNKSAARVTKQLIDQFASQYTETRTVKLEKLMHIYIFLLNVMNIGYYVVLILAQCKQIVCWTKHRLKSCLNTHCEHSTSIFDFINSIHNLTPVYRMLRLPRFRSLNRSINQSSKQENLQGRDRSIDRAEEIETHI